ncbi:abscisic acid receptor PYL3-like isoform X1 [Miscanthus floridulus]|uniref:abscisic acid receptor PYL3-like isoform X1 n=1 Tax=Miscanthus floridulus TaxID=154761 RepID=UPI00345A8C46
MVEMDGGVGVVGGGGQTQEPRRWRLADELRCDLRAMETDYVRRFHRHEPRDHQCSSAVAKHIKAPVHLVWSLVRRFDQPQLFKPFVSRCEMKGNIEIGSVREVNVKSGLPATRSTERLELLDDNEHILSVRFVGGDHRLQVCFVLDVSMLSILHAVPSIKASLVCGSNSSMQTC